MAAQTRTYAGITPARFDALRAELRAHGIEAPDGDEGTFKTHGYTVTWTHGADDSLIVKLEGSPFFMGAAWQAVASGIEHVANAAV